MPKQKDVFQKLRESNVVSFFLGKPKDTVVSSSAQSMVGLETPPVKSSATNYSADIRNLNNGVERLEALKAEVIKQGMEYENIKEKSRDKGVTFDELKNAKDPFYKSLKAFTDQLHEVEALKSKLDSAPLTATQKLDYGAVMDIRSGSEKMAASRELYDDVTRRYDTYISESEQNAREQATGKHRHSLQVSEVSRPDPDAKIFEKYAETKPATTAGEQKAVQEVAPSPATPGLH